MLANGGVLVCRGTLYRRLSGRFGCMAAGTQFEAFDWTETVHTETTRPIAAHTHPVLALSAIDEWTGAALQIDDATGL